MAHAQQAAPRGRERPLPPRIALHLDAGPRRCRREPGPGRLLVKVARLELEQVDLVPCERHEPPRRLGVQGLPLLDGDLPRPVTHVVTGDPPLETGDGRRRSLDGEGSHLMPRFTFSLMGSPVAPR